MKAEHTCLTNTVAKSFVKVDKVRLSVKCCYVYMVKTLALICGGGGCILWLVSEAAQPILGQLQMNLIKTMDPNNSPTT
jgi:hypothetical protein